MLDAAVARPSAGVRPWVGRYVGYRMQGFPPGLHTGMPSHLLTFVISLGDPVEIVGMPGGRQAPRATQAFVAGLHAGPATIAHDGNQYGLSVDLTPLGARAVFGVPGGELASHVVDLDDLLGRTARTLPDRLAHLPTWKERFSVLDEVLTRAIAGRAERVVDPPPEVAHAFRLLVDSCGAAAIGRVADEVGWSRRHLGARFRAEVGLAPKATARVVRFDRAKGLLAKGARLADVAAAAGYADQAHFTREFRELAGRTPRAWLAEDLPSVQDPERVDIGD